MVNRQKAFMFVCRAWGGAKYFEIEKNKMRRMGWWGGDKKIHKLVVWYLIIMHVVLNVKFTLYI